MSVRVTTSGGVTEHVALYDSGTGLAFGPIFDTEDDAGNFLAHLDEIGERDPRIIPAGDLAALHAEWDEERA